MSSPGRTARQQAEAILHTQVHSVCLATSASSVYVLLASPVYYAHANLPGQLLAMLQRLPATPPPPPGHLPCPPHPQKAVQDFLAAGGGVMFLGPNPLPRDPSEGASSPSSPPPQPALRPPPARKPKKARKPKARATAATTTVSAPSQFVLTPSSPMATFTVLGGGTGRRLLQRFNASFQLNKVWKPCAHRHVH